MELKDLNEQCKKTLDGFNAKNVDAYPILMREMKDIHQLCLDHGFPFKKLSWSQWSKYSLNNTTLLASLIDTFPQYSQEEAENEKSRQLYSVFFDVIDLALSLGAGMNDNNSHRGADALVCAIKKGHLKLVEKVIHGGGDLHAHSRGTPLDEARFRFSKKRSVLSYYIENIDRFMDLKDESEPILRCLIEHGASVNEVNFSGISILMQCVMCDDKETMVILLEKGATFNQEDHQGWTIWHYALKFYTPEVLELLLDHQKSLGNIKDALPQEGLLKVLEKVETEGWRSWQFGDVEGQNSDWKSSIAYPVIVGLEKSITEQDELIRITEQVKLGGEGSDARISKSVPRL